MKKLILSLSAVALAAGAHAQTIIADANSFVDSGATTTNFGSTPQLLIRGAGGGNTEKLYYQFDVGGILAAGETFDNVEFKLGTHPNQSSSTVGPDWTLHGITDNNDSWTQSGITWDNAPKNDTSGTGVLSSGTTTLANFSLGSTPAGENIYTINGSDLDEYLNWKAGAIADPYGNGAASNTIATIIVTSNNGALGRIWNEDSTGTLAREPRLDLTVIPEPASAGLAVGALVGLLVFRRRRN